MSGVRVNSRAELVAYLRANPIQLKPGRPPLGPRVGHPDFVGPIQPHVLKRIGAIGFDGSGSAVFVLKKEPWERSQCEAFERMEGLL